MRSGGRSTGSPRSRTVPSSGLSSPAASPSTVDFPHPDGPSSATNSPGFTCIEKSRSTSVSPLSS